MTSLSSTNNTSVAAGRGRAGEPRPPSTGTANNADVVGGQHDAGQLQQFIGIQGSVEARTVIGQWISQAPPRTVFDVLQPYFVPNALYGSAQRESEHATLCHPETQEKILGNIRSWAENAGAWGPRVCWLSGRAGTGKTTIAHTIAKEYDREKRLAATFFFWRRTGDRDDIHKVVPTIAYQIAEKFSSAKEGMEKILNECPSSELLSQLSGVKYQISKLLVHRPDSDTSSVDHKLIIIDGLDECASPEQAEHLIEALCKEDLPFQFLLTSRPEDYIKSAFAPFGHRGNILELFLEESQDNVRKVIAQGVVDNPRITHSLSDPDIDQLVKKSEGLMLYATLAIRYISDRKGDSKKRLKDVLKGHDGLDPLYRQVITDAKEYDHFNIVMGSLMYLRYPLGTNGLSGFLLSAEEPYNPLEDENIHNALNGCHSILVIPDDTTAITPYHASVRDFLTNKNRSEDLFFPPAVCHAQLMISSLEAIMTAFSMQTNAPEYALIAWHYHACLFLSAANEAARQKLEGMEEKAMELIEKINVDWVESWLTKALWWSGVGYLVVDLPGEKVSM